jgi:hypothetical protein
MDGMPEEGFHVLFVPWPILRCRLVAGLDIVLA